MFLDVCGLRGRAVSGTTNKCQMIGKSPGFWRGQDQGQWTSCSFPALLFTDLALDKSLRPPEAILSLTNGGQLFAAPSYPSRNEQLKPSLLNVLPVGGPQRWALFRAGLSWGRLQALSKACLLLGQPAMMTCRCGGGKAQPPCPSQWQFWGASLVQSSLWGWLRPLLGLVTFLPSLSVNPVSLSSLPQV